MKSIRTRLLAAITLIVVISGLAISQAVIHNYRSGLNEIAVEQAKTTAQNLSLIAADMVLINDVVALQRLLTDRLENDPNVGYLFVVHDEDIVAHTFSTGVPAGLLDGRTEAPDPGNIRRIQSRQGERFLDVAWPISDGRAGVLYLGYSEAPLETRVWELRVQATILTSLLLLAALSVGMILVRQITRPLLLLTEAVDRVDEFSLEAPVRTGTDDETGRLATAFNQMLTRLRAHTEQLEESRQSLEAKNLELERAHRQTRSLFDISRGLSALAGLNEICAFLVERLGGIISCKTISIVLFPLQGKTPVAFSGGNLFSIDDELYLHLEQIARFEDNWRFFEPEALNIHFDETKDLHRVAVFPFLHENRITGIFLVGCTNQCNCAETDLRVVRMVIDQSGGAIHRALSQQNEMEHLRQRIEKKTGYAGLIGKTPQMQMIYKLIEDVAPSDATVLIEGESGTGKELVAKAIHEKSPRKDKPFVVINCSAYPPTLLESELFGHEKGAFTGAIKRKPGRFEQANGGTIFLDEVGDIPPAAQVKLLRVLQNRKIERIGGSETVTVDIRILAAANKSLLGEVQAGRFREDLYYRLNVIPVHLPPLKERKNDIPYLARHFLIRFNELQNKQAEDFDAESMRRMLEYDWPGNVRELENTVEHAVVLSRENVIRLSDFPGAVSKAGASAGGSSGRPEGSAKSDDATLETNEKKLLTETLAACGGNKAEAARRLGIGRSTLYTKLKKHQIEYPSA